MVFRCVLNSGAERNIINMLSVLRVLLEHESTKQVLLQHVPDENEHRQLPFLSLLHLHVSCVILTLLRQRNLECHTIVPAIRHVKTSLQC